MVGGPPPDGEEGKRRIGPLQGQGKEQPHESWARSPSSLVLTPPNCSHQREPKNFKDLILRPFSLSLLFLPTSTHADAPTSNVSAFPLYFSKSCSQGAADMPPPPGSLPGPLHCSARMRHPSVSFVLELAVHSNSAATWGCQYLCGLTHTIQACTYACGGLAHPSMRESRPPKQSHEHPEAKGCIFHLPVSPYPTSRMAKGKGRGVGGNLVPDKPLIPPPPVPSSQSWAPAGWTDG